MGFAIAIALDSFHGFIFHGYVQCCFWREASGGSDPSTNGRSLVRIGVPDYHFRGQSMIPLETPRILLEYLPFGPGDFVNGFSGGDRDPNPVGYLKPEVYFRIVSSSKEREMDRVYSCYGTVFGRSYVNVQRAEDSFPSSAVNWRDSHGFDRFV